MKKVFFRRLIALVFIFFTSLAWAEETVPGDVLVVFKALPGTTVTRESLTEGGSDYERVKSIAEELDAEVIEIYVALSKARNVVFAFLHSETKSDKILIDELLSLPDVLSASPNYQSELNSASVSYEPNDTLYSQSKQWGLKAVRAPEAWKITSGDYSTYVAVIDTGIYYEHEDLVFNFDRLDSKNFYGGLTSAQVFVDHKSYFDEYGHGTHVAGIIGAHGDNNKGVIGVNKYTNIISLRIAGKDGTGQGDFYIAFLKIADDLIIQAVNYVLELLDKYPERRMVVNISFGGYRSESPEELIAKNAPYYLAFKTLSDTHRAVICVSAGNGDKDGNAFEVGSPISKDRIEGTNTNPNFYDYPASLRGIDNMIVVANAYETKSDITHNGRNYYRADDSNYSTTWVDIAAPGTKIYSTISRIHHEKYDNTEKYTMLDGNGNTYQEGDDIYPYVNMSGTSMATPFVSGAAALLFSKYPNASAEQIVRAIRAGANSHYAKNYTKYGFLNIDGAFRYMRNEKVPSGVPIDEFNFPDENFRAYIAEKLDKDSDGYLSKNEIYNVTEINVSGRHISSLEGIGNFQYLKKLNCSKNDFKNFQLEPYKKEQNPNLTEINLSYCEKLSYAYFADRENLVSLNFEGCRALTSVNCDNNKKLKNFNVNGCVALNELACVNSSLISLDLTGLSSLTVLSCFGNNIRELNLSPCPKLTGLNCSDNNIAMLDLTPCTLLQKDNVDISGQNIYELEITETNNEKYPYVVDFLKYIPKNNLSKVIVNKVFGYKKNGDTLPAPMIIVNVEDDSVFSFGFIEKPVKVSYVYKTDYSGKYNMDVTINKGFYPGSDPIVIPFPYDDNDDDDSDDPIAGSVSLNSDNFPDQYFMEYCSQFDINLDGKLSPSEISNIKSISISGYYYEGKYYYGILSISTLKGIEYFTELQYLDCRNQNIVSLDISKNKITELYCDYDKINEIICPEGDIPIDKVHFPDNVFRLYLLNYINNGNFIFTAEKIENVREIVFDLPEYLPPYNNGIPSLYNNGISSLKGIEYFTELEKLVVDLYSYTNKLTELDVTKNTKLQYLSCCGNKLSNLNLNNNLELKYLDCRENNITHLDISHNRLTELYCDLNVAEIVCNYGELAIDAVNFPDEKFREYVLGELNHNNHFFTASELQQIANRTKLDISGEYISNLNGIEFFTGLKELYCGNNKLEEIDLSKNTKLEYLSCYDNNITRLDVSKNKLTKLYCDDEVEEIICPAGDIPIDKVHFPDTNFRRYVLYENKNNGNRIFTPSGNDISKISGIYVNQTATTNDTFKISTLKGIEHFINLRYLECEHNKLTELDLSKNTKLGYLTCSGNNITRLDVSNNKLTKLYCDDKVEEIICPAGDIPIDKVHFPDTNFRAYILRRNYDNRIFANNVPKASNTANIKYIDVSYSKISTLKGIEYFTKLESLSCQGNNLTKLDLKKNTKLKYLDCQLNNIKSLSLSKNKLTELYCDEKVTKIVCPAGYIPIDSIHFPDINFRRSIIYINYGNSIFTASDIEKITEIDVYSQDISNLKGIEYFKNLEYLDCKSNDIVSLDLAQNTKLKFLDCSNTNIVSLDISKNKIIELYCNNDIEQIICPSGDVGIDKINFPDENFRLRCIYDYADYTHRYDYNENHILTASDIKEIFTLDFSNEEISNLKGIEYFTELQWLDCSHNKLVSLDLSKNKKLEWLRCDDLKEIKCPAGYIPIVERYFPNESFRYSLSKVLDSRIFKPSEIEGIDINDDITNLKGIEYFTELKWLDCSHNKLVSLDLTKNTKLESLTCIYNELTELKINKCTNLMYLDCRYNNISKLNVGGCTKLLSSGTIDKDETTKLIYDESFKPKFNGSFTSKGIVKKPYSSSITIIGGFEPYDLTTSGTLPKGLELEYDSQKITLKGTPTTAKTYTFTLKLTDRNGIAVSKKFTITITKPVISGDITAKGVVKKSYSSTLTISGGTSPYTWSKSSGTLPAGLSLNPNSTGTKLTIKGIPTTAKAYTFTLKATDKNGATASKKFTVTITKPVISGDIKASGVVKKSYSSGITISGGTSPYKWSKSSGTLPVGLNLNPNSTGTKLTIKGIPTNAKAYTFTLKATDKNGATASKKFTVTITKPTISGDITAKGVVKKSYSSTLTISGGTSPYTWVKSSGTLPVGLEIVSRSSGTKLYLKGTPTTAKAYTFTLKATDKNGATASKKFTVTITKPTISGILTASGTVKSSYSSSISVSKGTSPYKWAKSKGTLPEGLKLSTNSSGTKLYLKGTPKTAKAYTFTLKVTDKNGATASKEFTVTIAKATTNKSGESINDVSKNTKDLSSIQVVPDLEKTEINYVSQRLAELKISSDILWQGEGKDEDLIGVQANEPLTFFIENSPSDMQVIIDDKITEGIEISEEGSFTLPAEFVSDDFKVRAENDEIETNEMLISVEN